MTQLKIRRSASIEERKSRPDDGKERKQVTWSPIETTVQEKVDLYSDIAADAIWYSGEDLREIRSHNERVAALFSLESSAEGNMACPETPEDTLRGLESKTEQGAWERFEHVRDCRNRVLDEQDRQHGIDNMEYQYTPYPLVKRVNHLNVSFDYERLAALCRDATAKARRVATQRGNQDHLAVMGEPEQDNEPATGAKDTDTVQTVTSTEFALSVNSESSTEEESNDHTPTPAPAPPVPTEVRCRPPLPRRASTSLEQKARCSPSVPHGTTSLLQRKHQERYAAYLSKRQLRIEEAAAAREKAESERKQKRAARKASLRKEADANIDQLKRIMKVSDEFISLIAAGRQ